MFVRGSGSTWVAAMLNQQNQIKCGSETKLTEAFFDPATCTPNKFEGYKNKMDHIPDWAQKKILDKEPGANFTFIFLHRRDFVRHAIGLCRKNHLAPRLTHKAGKGNAWSEEHVVPPFPISIEELATELNFVKEEVTLLNEFEKKLHEVGIQTLNIYYEDLLEDTNKVMRQIFSWITGAEDGFVEPRQVAGEVPIKNTPNELEKVVTNLDEVKEYVTTHTDFKFYD